MKDKLNRLHIERQQKALAFSRNFRFSTKTERNLRDYPQGKKSFLQQKSKIHLILKTLQHWVCKQRGREPLEEY